MSQAPVHTQEDDRSGSNEEQNTKALFGLVFILVSPFTVLATLAVYVTFVYFKVKRSVILLFASPLLLGTLIFIKPAFTWFMESWTVTLPSMISQEVGIFAGVLQMLSQQFLLGTSLGILIGLAIASWKWYTRARWQSWDFKKTPWELRKKARNIRQIQNDENGPSEGMTLGVNPDGIRITQTLDEASAHTLIIGGSGSGKSETSLVRVRDQIRRHEGVCLIDLKGDPKLAVKVKKWCDRYGVTFREFTLQDITKPYLGPSDFGNSHYDPISHGDHTRRADMILDLRDWAGADVWKKMSQSYFQLLFDVLIHNPRPGISTLEDAVDLMNPKYLQERARPLASDPRLASLVRSIDTMNDDKATQKFRDNLQTNRSQLEIFLQSIAGPWLKLDTKNPENNINLLQTAYEGEVVLFSLDSQAYGSLAADLANLIIQDLKTVSSELLKNPAERPFHVLIDEFSAIGSDNIVGLVNKARAANMSVTLATQTIGDLMINNPAFKNQMLGIISSFIIHRANTPDDATIYSGLTGAVTTNKMTRQSVDYDQSLFGGIGSGAGTGAGSVEEKEEWRVSPTEIQHLDKGEMIFISTASHRVERVRCYIENPNNPKFLASTPRKEPLSVNQEFTRETQSQPTMGNEQLFDLEKEEPQMAKRKPKAASSDAGLNPQEQFQRNAAEVGDMKKEEVNYNLLRAFFNDVEEVDEQEQSDLADGMRVQTPTSPSRRPTTTRPRPVTPTRPTPAEKKPSKTEFDF